VIPYVNLYPYIDLWKKTKSSLGQMIHTSVYLFFLRKVCVAQSSIFILCCFVISSMLLRWLSCTVHVLFLVKSGNILSIVWWGFDTNVSTFQGENWDKFKFFCICEIYPVGGLLVPKGIIRPLVTVSALLWFIVYINIAIDRS
jgi:hypothetical protein